MENTEQKATKSTLPPLEDVCAVCGGEGSFRVRDGSRSCSACGGSGYMPTDLGEQILAFMKHHLPAAN